MPYHHSDQSHILSINNLAFPSAAAPLSLAAQRGRHPLLFFAEGGNGEVNKKVGSVDYQARLQWTGNKDNKFQPNGNDCSHMLKTAKQLLI